MPTPEISVLVDLEGWPDDAARFMASLDSHRGDRSVEVIAAHQTSDLGFGAAQNMALAAATGDVVVLVDTSLELTGDLFGDLVTALEDPTVAVAGPYGLVTVDLCDYEERTVGDVAAVQGYCLAARRADLVAAGGVQEAFTWYRNADIDVSLRLRTLDEPPVRRAVAAGAGHCTRHTHRAWEATPEAERGERSRHNMGIVHEVFFGRKDLTV
ncbi:MAG: cysteinyl-tRNA synthetase [Actinomycetota bacterium]|jgi:GT2 family glycosyltransferase|nr:cysteinyl-tRNA synthetase [Actinomycetota bacterium]